MRTIVNWYISDCEQNSSSAPEYGEKRVYVGRKSVKEERAARKDIKRNSPRMNSVGRGTQRKKTAAAYSKT